MAVPALRLYAGPRARQHIARHGLSPQDVSVVPGAAGGPKGLILAPLDQFLFGDWLPRSQQPVHLVGASIGAWRLATACLSDAGPALGRFAQAYIHQDYEVPPGRKQPTADHVTQRFADSLRGFYAGRLDEVLRHPRYRLHVVTARGRHVLRREHPVATPLGYAGAFLSNALHRPALGAWLERVVFSAGEGALPFDTQDLRTRQVAMDEANFFPAVQASCTIPFWLRAVHDIPGAPPGAYWDGGITDYHLHLRYRPPAQGTVEGAGAGLVLYPHFQQAVVPGWLDKGLRWRHRSTPALDGMLVLAPDPAWVATLPHGKLPDRRDFIHYGYGPGARLRAQVWTAAVSASQQLADEFAQWLERPDPARLEPL